MAAPTPVRSLVHSSTLVTAGVWLIIRFREASSFGIFFWGILGISTLIVAGLAALIETDAKKTVALSTLRQLGLIFIAFSIGIPIICFFHIIIHAFAKANLFIIIGNLLHNSFSQQDSRLIRSSTINIFIVLASTTRILRLIGLTFTSGFFSKEQILIGQPFIFNRLLSLSLILLIAGLTTAYCLKLMRTIFYINTESLFQKRLISLRQFIPIITIRTLTIVSGLLCSYNLYPCLFFLGRVERIF